MGETTEVQGTKRVRGQRRSNLGKRRGPYAMRACDACRRRKGKCDGSQPCGHCQTRKQSCRFSEPNHTEELGDRPIFGSNHARSGQPDEVECESSSASQYVADTFSGVISLAESAKSPQMNSQTTDRCKGDAALMGLVSNLQEQLDNLTSRVWLSTLHRDDESTTQTASSSDTERLAAVGNTARTLIQRFHGPTSPDYSLNMAQIRLRQHSFSTRSQRPLLASINDETVSGDETDCENGYGSSISGESWHSRHRAKQSGLQHFRSIMSLQDAVRLLLVYQEVVGDFHPLVDLNDLISQVRAWYADLDATSSGRQDSFVQSAILESDENSLLIHLALAIALRAESTSSTSDIETKLQNRFQDALNAKLAFPASGIKDVVAVLLAVNAPTLAALIMGIVLTDIFVGSVLLL